MNFNRHADFTWYIDALKTTMQHAYGPLDGALRLITFEQLCKYGKVSGIEGQTLCEAYMT